MIRIVMGFVLWWFSFGFVATYASIWHSQTYPSRNVSVTLTESRFLTGDLHQDWNRKWVLTEADGRENRFNDSEVVVMAFSPPPPGAALGYAKMWRSWGPVVIFTGVFWLWLLAPQIRSICTRAKTDT